jgi:hypothetical protein
MGRVAVAILFALFPSPALAWGLAAHAMITRTAVEKTQPPLRAFLRTHRETLVDRSLEPDTVLRERDGDRERRRHYLDLEVLSRPPFTDIPADEREARARYGPSRMRRAGTLPWNAARVYGQLVRAVRERDRDRILTLAGHLAHYVEDAHSPLHSTVNYDGQLTGNDGIHALYEGAMIERRAKFFRDLGSDAPVEATAKPKVAERILEDLRVGHRGVDAILAADVAARRAGAPGSDAYLDALFERVGRSARDRMREAARETALLWTSAWVEAGEPDLSTRRGRLPPP